MNDEAFNLSLRKFLKTVGVGSQREIEQAVQRALADGKVAGNATFPVKMTLEAPGVALKVDFEGTISLE